MRVPALVDPLAALWARLASGGALSFATRLVLHAIAGLERADLSARLAVGAGGAAEESMGHFRPFAALFLKSSASRT